MATLSKNDFLKGLKKSGVIETERLVEWLKESNLETPQELASKLVKDKLLTRWQAKYLMTGRTRLDIGSYRLLERIQRDDMGDRFLALHTSLARKVDIQVLSAELSKDKTSFTPFLQQASKAATLDHPNLVHVYDIDQEGGRYFLVTEHLEGETLTEQKAASITPARVAKLTREILQGLQHSHEHGVVHGSLLPGDVMFTKRGEIKLNNIAIAPLRRIIKGKQEGEVAPKPQQDFASLSKLGLKLLSKVPEEDLDQSYLHLTKIINSVADGDPESVNTAIEKLESFAAESPAASIDGNANGSAGGFDSPVASKLTRKPKKPTKTPEEPEDDDDLEVPTPGLISTFWQSNPVAFIATCSVLGLALIGGSVFGAMKMLAKPDKVPAAIADAEKQKPPGTNKTSLSKNETKPPTFEIKKDAEIDEDQAQAMIDQVLPAGEEMDVFGKKANRKKTLTVFKDLRARREISKANRVIPADTPLVLIEENTERGMKVQWVLGDEIPQKMWVKADDVYDAGEVAVAGEGGLKVAPTNEAPAPAEGTEAAVVDAMDGNSTTDQPETSPQPNMAAVTTDATPAPSANLPDDDLAKKIVDLGPSTQKVLYDHGIKRFQQLADLTPDEVMKMAENTSIEFRTTVEKAEKWIADAKILAAADPKTDSTSPTTTPKTAAAKPAAPNEPLKTFPREVQLPDITLLDEVTLADLKIKKTYRLGAEILNEEGTTKQKLIFQLTRGDKATGTNSDEEKQRWLIGVKRREKDKPNNFAMFRKSAEQFHFQWLPEAEKNKYAEYVRNCKVRLTLPDETQTVFSLRKPMGIPDLRLTEEKLENTIEVVIPAMPVPESIVIEVLPLKIKDTETNVIVSQVRPNAAAEIWLKKSDKTGFLRMYVGSEFKNNKITLRSNLVFWDRERDSYTPIKSKEGFATLANRINQDRNAATNLYNAKKDDKKIPKYEKDDLEKKMKAAQARTELMTQYGLILQKVMNQPISVRIYSKLGKTQLMLAETDPKMEQPTKKKKRR